MRVSRRLRFDIKSINTSHFPKDFFGESDINTSHVTRILEDFRQMKNTKCRRNLKLKFDLLHKKMQHWSNNFMVPKTSTAWDTEGESSEHENSDLAKISPQKPLQKQLDPQRNSESLSWSRRKLKYQQNHLRYNEACVINNFGKDSSTSARTWTQEKEVPNSDLILRFPDSQIENSKRLQSI